MMPPKGAVLGGGRRKKRDFFDGGVDDRRRRRRFFFSLLFVVLERIASVAIGLASVAIVVDDFWTVSSTIGNDITKASSSSFKASSHKYAFTPTNDKMEYAWAVKGRALPSETRDAKLGTTEPEFKYMHMAMPTVLPDGSIAVGACFTGAKYAHAACSFNSSFAALEFFFCVCMRVPSSYRLVSLRARAYSVSSVANRVRRFNPASVILGDIERRRVDIFYA